MTPRERAVRANHAALFLCPFVALVWVVHLTEGSAVHLGHALVVTLLFAAVLFARITTSRCPKCRRFINLAGPSGNCPHCGEWLPLDESDQPPVETNPR
jgi:hypothetical protein